MSGSLSARAQFCGVNSWKTWGQPAEYVRDGDGVRKRVEGSDGFNHLQVDRDTALLFNRAKVLLTASVATEIVKAIDFTSTKSVVDVSGGFGGFVGAVLSDHPRMRDDLFDLAHATEGTAHRLAAIGVAD